MSVQACQNVDDVQSLVVRPPLGRWVAHLVLRVPEGKGQRAAELLETRMNEVCFGLLGSEASLNCSVGFTFAGLEALGMADGYLRIFRRLAAAYSAGAVLRSDVLGDSGASAAHHWLPMFRHEHAHVLLTWHGPTEREVMDTAKAFSDDWAAHLQTDVPSCPLVGGCLAPPEGQRGDWVHFGFRDSLSEVSIDGNRHPPSKAPDLRPHARGALLLNEVNDAGFNSFPLNTAPDKVRNFFASSTFGVLRPLSLDVGAFEARVTDWAEEIAPHLGLPVPDEAARRDFVKAKLCGRWPDGRPLRPGDVVPRGRSDNDADLKFDLGTDGDPLGQGCPFGSHVRRMRSGPDGHGNTYARPLQRRSVPFGPAWWPGGASPDVPRGHLAHFFCASLEDQFEHLLGQWAAGAPLGLAAGDQAMDPLCGTHADPDAALLVPMQGRPTQPLRGFGGWTTTLGTLYAWHPGRDGLKALLSHDYVSEEDERHWL
jgi:hypothetical protein